MLDKLMAEEARFNIQFEFRDSLFGGANQFLKALKAELVRRETYADDPVDADVVLFNSHHHVDRVLTLRRQLPATVFIHRVDGPMRLYTGPDDSRDAMVNRANRTLADATVFQSHWSRRANKKLGFPDSPFEAVIGNAPDPAVFNVETHEPPRPGEKIRIIATGWSPNPNKGFDVYSALDRDLDFDRFDMTYVGRTPVEFVNISVVPPCTPAEVAIHLRRSHVFITASLNDPCSNALIEALHCGLPALARNDGGHPEIVGDGGELFTDAREIPALSERVIRDYQRYRANIHLPTISDIAEQYLNFAGTLMVAVRENRLKPKRIGVIQRFLLTRFSR